MVDITTDTMTNIMIFREPAAAEGSVNASRLKNVDTPSESSMKATVFITHVIITYNNIPYSRAERTDKKRSDFYAA